MGTAFAWHQARTSQIQLDTLEFSYRAEQTLATIKIQLDTYEQLLHRSATFLSSNITVSRNQWRDHALQLKLQDPLSGAQGIGFAKIVPYAEKAIHLAAIRQEGFPDYDIRPPGSRDVFTPALYIEPFARPNLLTFGFDLSLEPAIRTALDITRDTGAAALSEKISLIKTSDDKLKTGFLMILAVYGGTQAPASIEERRSKLSGYVYIPFLMNDLLRNALGEAGANMVFRRVEPSQPGSVNLINETSESSYSHAKMPFPTREAFTKTAIVNFDGQPWAISLESKPPVYASNAAKKTDLAAGAGLLFSFLFFWFAHHLTRTGNRASQLANAMTTNNRELETRLTSIIDLATEGIISIDKKHEIVFFNPAAERIFQCAATDAIGSPLSRFIPKRFRGAGPLHIEKFSDAGISAYRMDKPYEHIGVRSNGKKFPFEATISKVLLQGQELYTVMLREMTEYESTNAAQKVKQARLERLESIANFGNYEIVATSDGNQPNTQESTRISRWSAQMYRIVGANPEYGPIPIPEYITKFVHPDDQTHTRTAFEKAFTESGNTKLEYRIICSDGSIKYMYDLIEFISSSANGNTFLGQLHDITERKRAQAELERSHHDLQKMIAALDSLREEEQKRLAHEMHDDLGQLLAAMKMDLSTLQQSLPQDNAKVRQQLNNINELVDAMMMSIRRIIADLPPKVMEDLGLFSALQLLVSNFEKRHQIASTLKTPKPEPALKEEIATPIYRMVQEALNNVAKHAQATRVEIRIDRRGSHLILRINDNGTGISTDKLRKPGSFGLIGMRERTTALGGEFTIESANSVGTTIQIILPMESPVAENLDIQS